MSSDRLSPFNGVGDLIRQAEERGRLEERTRCSLVAQLYPFVPYNEEHREILRLRDDLSQAIALGLSPGERLK